MTDEDCKNLFNHHHQHEVGFDRSPHYVAIKLWPQVSPGFRVRQSSQSLAMQLQHFLISHLLGSSSSQSAGMLSTIYVSKNKEHTAKNMVNGLSKMKVARLDPCQLPPIFLSDQQT